MLFAEGLHVFRNDGFGEADGGVVAVVFLVKLEKQAFLQVAGADAGRVEILDFNENALEVVFVGDDILAESKVVRDGAQFSPQVSVFVDAVDEVDGQGEVFLVAKGGAGLFFQKFLEGRRAGDGNIALVVVVVFVEPEAAFVVVITQQFVDIDVIAEGFFFGTNVFGIGKSVFFFRLAGFKCRIVKQFLLQLFFKVERVQLQQFDELNLLRAQLLK